MLKKSAYVILGSILAIQFLTGSTFAADPTSSPTTTSTLTPTVSGSPTPTTSTTVTPTSSASATPTPIKSEPTSKAAAGGDEKKKEVLGKASVLGSTSAGLEIAKWLIGGTVGFLAVLIGFKIARSNNVEE